MRHLAFFLLIFINFSCLAQTLPNNNSFFKNPFGKEEIELLEKLSQRHEVLIKKEIGLQKKEQKLLLKEKELFEKELKIKRMEEKLSQQSFLTTKTEIQELLILPSSRLKQVLETKTNIEIAELLSQASPALQQHFLNKINASRHLEIMQKIKEINK